MWSELRDHPGTTGLLFHVLAGQLVPAGVEPLDLDLLTRADQTAFSSSGNPIDVFLLDRVGNLKKIRIVPKVIFPF